jgi:hypothetical protein
MVTALYAKRPSGDFTVVIGVDPRGNYKAFMQTPANSWQKEGILKRMNLTQEGAIPGVSVELGAQVIDRAETIGKSDLTVEGLKELVDEALDE